MVTGESHYVQGRRYRLSIVEHEGPPEVRFTKNTIMELRVRPGMSAHQREAVLQRWYREQLRAQIPPLIAKWEPALGVRVAEWGIRKMKTHWGTCNTAAGRIWINLELAKKQASCLEYVLVHEMVHLLERHHNECFKGLMDTYMPQWRIYRDRLNRAPLSHEDWLY
jgi:predicted metal-dependent hydrolase